MPDPVSIWQQVKWVAASGDFEGAEKIDVPVLGGWEPEEVTTEVYPVLRGNGTAHDKYPPFQWPVLSELHQLFAKHGLGFPAVANML